jgi:hypothetical protein
MVIDNLPCLTCSGRTYHELFLCFDCVKYFAYFLGLNMLTALWYSPVLRSLYAYIIGYALLGALVDHADTRLPAAADLLVAGNLLAVGIVIALVVLVPRPDPPQLGWLGILLVPLYAVAHTWLGRRYLTQHRAPGVRRIVAGLQYPRRVFLCVPVLALAIPTLLFPISVGVAHFCCAVLITAWLLYHCWFD